MQKPAIYLFVVFLSTLAHSQSCPTTVNPKAKEVPLCAVTQQVTGALKAYNMQAHDLKLTSGAIDFKTTVSNTSGVNLGIFVFKLGGSREKDVTNDLTFTYEPPPPPAPSAASTNKMIDAKITLTDSLNNVLEKISEQLKVATDIDGVPLSKVTLTIAFGINVDASATGGGTISLVTLGGTIDRKRADTQSVTLTFERIQRNSK